VAVRVAAERGEEARARFVELCPGGFEETEGDPLELAAYTDAAGEESIRAEFTSATSDPVEPGWEDTWREFHRPVRIGPLWVGPPWLEPDPDALAVVVDPGQAFGTGAHATTRLCLELLLDAPRGSLADLGCGSGVLAIAAAKLGFAPVTALDVDDVVVAIARENANRNGVEIDVRAADVLSDDLPQTDIAVANIELGPVTALASRVRARTWVTSGYRPHDPFDLSGWRSIERREADGWAADRLERS
jgi:ribosomal protein L11 methyltransferase